MTHTISDPANTTKLTAPRVEDIMRRNPVTISPQEILAAAEAVMLREGMRQLPVVENGELVGIVSERDLRAHSGYLERTKVDAAMTYSALTVAPTDTALSAAHLLIERKFNALPVVENGRLVGIVSRTDLLQLLVSLLEQRQPA
jgi:acetoin utilization protein AcuB